MAFIVKKNIGGKDYFYLRQSKREGKKVKSICLAYLGKTRKEAEKKAQEIIKNMNKEKKPEEKKIKHMEKKTELKEKNISIEEMSSFCKRKGFVYPSGEIYGGFAGFWDFGPLGVEIKNNLKNEWWNFFVRQREDMTGIDGAIITNPKVWEASGHVSKFVDVAVVCKKCGAKTKIDKHELGKARCEKCKGEFINKGEFNPMFTTQVGPIKEESIKAYLRPETAQLIFADFKFVQENARMKLPFGIAQIGKSFRNELAPRDFLFRLREFEQMEIEYFIKPNQKCPYKLGNTEILIYSAEMQEKETEPVKMKIKDAYEKEIIKKDWHAYWIEQELLWFAKLGANKDKFRIRQHLSDERSHYSSDTWDLQYNFPFGWSELQGIADRGDYDLKQHETFSGKDLKIFDEETKEKFLPHVVCEPSQGVERAFLVFMFDSYFYDEKRGNIVLRLNPKLSPIKAAIFPIVKREELENFARRVFDDLKKEWNVIYDDSGSIGRRYARNDEAGTPFCITIDEDSLKKEDVTIRLRDTTEQVRIKVSDLKDSIRRAIDGENILKFGKITDTRKKI